MLMEQGPMWCLTRVPWMRVWKSLPISSVLFECSLCLRPRNVATWAGLFVKGRTHERIVNGPQVRTKRAALGAQEDGKAGRMFNDLPIFPSSLAMQLRRRELLAATALALAGCV